MSVFYRVENVEKFFGVTYTSEQRASLKDIPTTVDVLKACAGTHMLFPGFPLSLLDVRDKHPALLHSDGWYVEGKHVFSRQPVPLQWHLLRTTPVPDSFSKTWDEQQALLLPDEEVPTAALIVFATMLHFKASGRRLFERRFIRTSDVVSDGLRVFVGYFDADGFDVDCCWDDGRDGALGVASARKF